MEESFYKTLGLDVKASMDSIKAAYKKLALKFHPDRNQESGAQQRFMAISEAYNVLSNEKLRREYDAALLNGQSQKQATSSETMRKAKAEMDPQKLFNSVVGQIFARSQQKDEAHLPKGKKVDMHFDVTPKELDTGIRYQWKRKLVCRACSGGTSMPCSRCKKGVRTVGGKLKKCVTCNGSGVSAVNDCPTCDGRGHSSELREAVLTVMLAQLGHSTRLKGEGDEALRNGFGDVVFHWKGDPESFGQFMGDPQAPSVPNSTDEKKSMPTSLAPPPTETPVVPPIAPPVISPVEGIGRIMSAPDLQGLGGDQGASVSARNDDVLGDRRRTAPVAAPPDMTETAVDDASLAVEHRIDLSLKEALCGGIYFPVDIPGGERIIIESAPGEVIQPGQIRLVNGKGPGGRNVLIRYQVELPNLKKSDLSKLAKMLPSPQRPYIDRKAVTKSFGQKELVDFIRQRRKVSHHSASDEDSFYRTGGETELSSI